MLEMWTVVVRREFVNADISEEWPYYVALVKAKGEVEAVELAKKEAHVAFATDLKVSKGVKFQTAFFKQFPNASKAWSTVVVFNGHHNAYLSVALNLG